MIKKIITTITLVSSISAFGDSLNRNGDCRIALLTNESLTGYGEDVIAATIKKGYRPSLVKADEFRKTARVGELALEFSVNINYSSKKCEQKVKIVEVSSLNPLNTVILAAGQMTKKTYFGSTIRCPALSLIDDLPKCK